MFYFVVERSHSILSFENWAFLVTLGHLFLPSVLFLQIENVEGKVIPKCSGNCFKILEVLKISSPLVKEGNYFRIFK